MVSEMEEGVHGCVRKGTNTTFLACDFMRMGGKLVFEIGGDGRGLRRGSVFRY
jgi:hypothetical protein